MLYVTHIYQSAHGIDGCGNQGGIADIDFHKRAEDSGENGIFFGLTALWTEIMKARKTWNERKTGTD